MSKMTIDTLLAQTLGFNTKSFSESSRMRSKRRLSDGKPYSYGETIRALVTINSDKYAMIAEAATLKADLVTMKAFKEDSSKIIEKAKGAAKGVWETIKKLIGALLDLIKNFLRKFGSREKQLDAIIKGAEAVLARKLDTAKSDKLKDKKAAVYVGGGFKAISLIKQFRDLGMETVMVGTQTGRPEEYETIRRLADTDTVILDDANPTELEHFMRERGADILVGGVKERPLAYKLGVSFLDHNHERKHPLCGFEGSINFAKEAYESMLSPVWDIVREYRKSVGELNG